VIAPTAIASALLVVTAAVVVRGAMMRAVTMALVPASALRG
jgi:hypothetical protein